MRKFCGSCGAKHTVLDGHQPCVACGETDWSNPIPVAVCIQPVANGTKTVGLLIAKRAIEPKRGTWCLIGGHIEDGESVEDGAARELSEETNTPIGPLPRLTRSYANGKGHVLIVAEFPLIGVHDVLEMTPCAENEEIGVITSPQEMGFPIHTWAVKAWFDEHLKTDVDAQERKS